MLVLTSLAIVTGESVVNIDFGDGILPGTTGVGVCCLLSSQHLFLLSQVQILYV